jgi:hypothetical protein
LASGTKLYQKELERIIRERLKFLEKILEISQPDIENLKKKQKKAKNGGFGFWARSPSPASAAYAKQ